MLLTSDALALLDAIRQFPDEDVPRLAFADEIEADDAERAELVRVQCSLARFDWRNCGGYYCQTYDTGNVAHRDCQGERWRLREQELLTANERRWRFVACPYCNGTCKLLRPVAADVQKRSWQVSAPVAPHDQLFRIEEVECPHCVKGDAGGLCADFDFVPMRPPVGFVRGMKRVRVDAKNLWRQVETEEVCGRCHGRDEVIDFAPASGPLASSCKACPQCQQQKKVKRIEWKPTRLALSVCRHHPDVTEFWLADREPFYGASDYPSFSWFRGMDGFTTPNRLPEPVWDMLTGTCVARLKVFDTRPAADLELARCACRWVRTFLP
jgi:uncharacterized protein (TIGR02996 family)